MQHEVVAVQTPHESLVLNEKRGLLVAVMGNPVVYPGVVDVYDLNEDCRDPALQSSLPVSLLGHESGFAPDGNTFYATSLSAGQIVLRRKGGRFSRVRGHYQRESCKLLRSFKLERPVFGGRRAAPLRIAYRLSSAARVTVTVTRQGKRVKRFKPANRAARRERDESCTHDGPPTRAR